MTYRGLDGPPCPERSTLDQHTPAGSRPCQAMCIRCGRVTARRGPDGYPWCGAGGEFDACVACGHAMDQVIREEGYDRHPGCEMGERISKCGRCGVSGEDCRCEGYKPSSDGEIRDPEKHVRRIRVHCAARGSTFIVDTWRGTVTGVTGTNTDLLGMPERDAAAALKAQGATFAPLDERTEVRTARGYRAREDR